MTSVGFWCNVSSSSAVSFRRAKLAQWSPRRVLYHQQTEGNEHKRGVV